MNKISKGKAIGLLSLGLASVALGSVGFASWIVSGTTFTQAGDVTVTVGDVTDQRITVSAVLNAEDKTVNLDADAAKYGASTGPIKGSGNKAEDLTFKIDVTGTRKSGYSGTTYACRFKVTLPVTSDYVYLKTVESGATKSESGEYWNIDLPVSTSGTTTTYTFTLDWGTKFTSKNPAAIGKDEVTDEQLTQIIADLGELQTSFATAIKVELSSQA